MTYPPQAPRSSGFTLLEILVVIAVIATLAVIGISSGKVLVTQARAVESTANLRSLAIANAGYAADFGCYCPADDQYNNRRWHGARTSAQGKFDPTAGFLSPYLGKSQRVVSCPLMAALVTASDSFETGTGGYGYNSAYIGGRPGSPFDKLTKLRVSARTSQVTNPSQTVMFATTAYARADGLQEYPYCEPPFWDFGAGPTGSRPSPSVHFRANGKALVAWCDGRVTAETKSAAGDGTNLHGGDEGKWDLGWFGPDANNGRWNPQN